MSIKEAPKGYHFEPSLRWFKTEVSVPEYLVQGQNLFDQPPIVWALENERIFPISAFTPTPIGFDVGRMLVLNIWLRHYDTDRKKIYSSVSGGMTTKQRLQMLEKSFLSDGSPVTDVATGMCRRLTKFFLPYEDIREYLNEKTRKGNEFDQWGRSGNPDSRFKIYTYPGWLEWRKDQQNAYQKTMEIQKYLGIGDGAPQGFSTEADVVSAMPSKPASNKFYRLVRSSEALS